MTTGTGVEESNTDALAPQQVATKKTRYTAREQESEEKHAQEKVAKAEVKASKRPAPATSQETADEKTRATPLGLNGDTGSQEEEAQDEARQERAEGAPAGEAQAGRDHAAAARSDGEPCTGHFARACRPDSSANPDGARRRHRSRTHSSGCAAFQTREPRSSGLSSYAEATDERLLCCRRAAL